MIDEILGFSSGWVAIVLTVASFLWIGVKERSGSITLLGRRLNSVELWIGCLTASIVVGLILLSLGIGLALKN